MIQSFKKWLFIYIRVDQKDSGTVMITKAGNLDTIPNFLNVPDAIAALNRLVDLETRASEENRRTL
jgi:hypothetical protein